MVDALKTFENEGWSLLKVQTLTDTAKCYENLNDWEKLLRTCAQIACANQLVTSDQKLQYCQKFRDIANQHIGKIILIPELCLFCITQGAKRIPPGGPRKGGQIASLNKTSRLLCYVVRIP